MARNYNEALLSNISSYYALPDRLKTMQDYEAVSMADAVDVETWTKQVVRNLPKAKPQM